MNTTCVATRPKNLMASHLDRLSLLLGRSICSYELLSIEQTNDLREQAKNMQRYPHHTHAFEFSAESERRFRQLVGCLFATCPTLVYLWTPLANSCGLMNPVNLKEIRFEFEFSPTTEGMVVVLSRDLLDSMILDFSDDAHGPRRVHVELSGARWGHRTDVRRAEL